MTSRIHLSTTAILLCHLLLAVTVVTSQTTTPALPLGEQVTIKAQSQEKEGAVFRLKGDVEVTFRDYLFRAQEVTYNSETGDLTAGGNVTFDGGPHDEHITASRAEYNVRTETGKFWDVVGTTGARVTGRNVVLTSSAPFSFRGKRVERISRDRFVVYDGSVTSCELPKPKWSFHARRVVVDAGDRARIYGSTFRLRNIPVIYFPYAAHPVDKLGRESGFLIPTIGQSSRKGFIFGDSIYWDINRSMDLTLGAEYYSRRGWAQNGQFRARPSEYSNIDVRYFGVLDRGFGPARVDQGGQDIHLNAEGFFPWGIRGVASLNYLSSFVFRLAFTEQYSQAVNSEVRSVAFLAKTLNGFHFSSQLARYQNFQSTQRGDVITIVHGPTLDVSTADRSFGATRFFWGFDTAIESVSRREPDFVTANFVGRYDIRPRISLPVLFRGWSFRPEIALRDTVYTQRRAPSGTGTGVGAPIADPTTRQAFDASFELRPPPLSRIFERTVLGRTWKHTIEPRFDYRYVTGVHNFQNIIRFDDRDVLSNTSELHYAIVHRLFAKTTGSGPECENPSKAEGCSRVREVLSWEVGQKYFFDPDFGGALVSGRRNVFTSSADFTGIAFLTEPRRFSPVVSRLRLQAGADTDILWQVDYDPKKGRMNASTAFVQHRFGEYFVGGSQTFLHSPGEVVTTNGLNAPVEFNQFRALAGYGHPNKRGVSMAANIGFDVNLGFLQYAAYQSTYNWDCCGFSVEYRRFALGTVRNENQFRFAFTLANVGTFGNLKRQERIF